MCNCELADSAPTHLPVMLEEVLRYLDPQPGQIVVDGTVGMGGHAGPIAQRLGPTGFLVGLDRDPSMIALARSRVSGCRCELREANFSELRGVLDQLGLDRVDAVLLDLGVCSAQIDDASRGFSMKRCGPLDMRLSPGAGQSAAELVNRLREEVLADIFYEFGEERRSRQIARAIVNARRQKMIETTEELAGIVRRAMPRGRGRERIDPATRVFQALRIAVNDELLCLQSALETLPDCLKPGGRAVVISFHSLEDRLVKEAFRHPERWELLVKKPLTPSRQEVERNRRARSAKLRAARLK